MSWYALTVAPRCERRVIFHLTTEHGLDAYCPTETVWTQRGRKRDRTQRPIISSYVFAYVRQDEDFSRVKSVDDVRGIVSFGGAPAVVPHAWIDEMRALETRGVFDLTQPRRITFEAGETVRIIGGPFSGFMAKVLGARGEGRVRVLLDELRGGAISVSVDKLEAA